jgi:hypothetical protein
MCQEVCKDSGCSNPAADHSRKIARPRKRRDSSARRRQLAHPLRRRLSTKHHVPDSGGNSENRIRLARMMRQMPRAQPLFDRKGRIHKMNPVMYVLIHGEPAHDTAVKNHPRRQTKPGDRPDQYDRSRNPRPQRKHRMRIAMMHVMQRRQERPMRMPQHPVDDILDQRPRKQPSHKNKNQKHLMILGLRQKLSNAAS